MPHHNRLNGLYVITDPTYCRPHGVVHAVAQAIEGGARIVQYRDKTASPKTKHEEAQALRLLCEQHDVLFLINDDVALAQEIGAHGVHLGQSDQAVSEARLALGADAIIGITCHADLALAQQAEQAGANYVALGRFYPSHTKPEAPPATLDSLRHAKQQLSCPVAAIGGITPDNAQPLRQAGADMLAVIHAVFGQADIRTAASNIAQHFA